MRTHQSDAMAGQLDGQVVIVTGGLGDVGGGVCRALVKAGARVVAFDVDPDRAHTADGIERAIRCDVTDRDACEAAVDEVVRDFGTVHALVNMAQDIMLGSPLLDATDDDMVRSFESGPTGTLRMMQLCQPLLKANGGGAIVNFASGAGTDGLPGHGPYAAAKEAIRGLTKVAAREWGVDNIRVNAVCPLASVIPDRIPAESLEVIPLGRIGDPERDIGSAVVFLAGPAVYITGRTLQVDGGAGTWR
jgi:NAD(P)-dependent dehydrogenase (short-subunit alcohol dehydrogenase family)